MRTGRLLIWPLALCSPCRNAEGVAGDLAGGRLGPVLRERPPGAPSWCVSPAGPSPQPSSASWLYSLLSWEADEIIRLCLPQRPSTSCFTFASVAASSRIARFLTFLTNEPLLSERTHKTIKIVFWNKYRFFFHLIEIFHMQDSVLSFYFLREARPRLIFGLSCMDLKDLYLLWNNSPTGTTGMLRKNHLKATYFPDLNSAQVLFY